MYTHYEHTWQGSEEITHVHPLQIRYRRDSNWKFLPTPNCFALPQSLGTLTEPGQPSQGPRNPAQGLGTTGNCANFENHRFTTQMHYAFQKGQASPGNQGGGLLRTSQRSLGESKNSFRQSLIGEKCCQNHRGCSTCSSKSERSI